MDAALAEDAEREDRIVMEAIVDCYGPEEQAIGWYYYLQNSIAFPFRARCAAERASSPLRVGEEVEVTGMASEDDCEHDMLVFTAWAGRRFAVPLAQLDPLDVDDATAQVIGDWHYWAKRGYQFG